MTTRYFFLWCSHCSTRITITTEETHDAARGVYADTPGWDTDNEPCPCCESGKLRDFDSLVAFGELPRGGWKPGEEPAIHAAWRASLQTDTAKTPA